VDINGGKGTMFGAVLSLLLIGLMRFGMGLLNIQGQVQGIVIGLLLILSILLPNVAQQISAIKSTRLDWQPVLISLGILVVFVAFFLFFFWSRAPVLIGS
jgi:rhamnose transport system permease protein